MHSFKFGTSESNWLLETDDGEYVVRISNDVKELQREATHARLINKYTQLDASHPIALDQASDDINYAYLLSTKLPGISAANPSVWQNLDAKGRSRLTLAFGRTLGLLQQLSSSKPGIYFGDVDDFAPFTGSTADWIQTRMEALFRLWRQTKNADYENSQVWAVDLVRRSLPAFDVDYPAVFVHHDYTLANVLACGNSGEIHLNGIVDLAEGYFGLGEADLIRTVAMFGKTHPHRVKEFVDGYREVAQLASGYLERFPTFMLEDRLCVWLADRLRGDAILPSSFKQYVEPFLELASY